MKVLVPWCLDACPLITIHQFFQKSWRYLDVYRYVCDCTITHTHHLDNMTSRKGLDTHQAAFANKQYKSHQRVGLPTNIIEALASQDG